ncbi:MAG: alpha-amylase [Dehalococcoidia bacterium]|nr:alpha-amylase [Dehalococcoidia bacterium]
MSNAVRILATPRPGRVADVPRALANGAYPSPADWRNEVLYFLLPDRFSDGQEHTRELLDRDDRAAARPAAPSGEPWRWDRWARSGADRWQGGTIAGITGRLDYLRDLGVTAIWVGPVFKQRGHLDTYHGYGIQDFLEVDPRFGTREELVAMVAAAHAREMRVILDVIFNHSGANFDYAVGGNRVRTPAYRPWPGFYADIAWRGGDDTLAATPGPDDAAWPAELQDSAIYTRAGMGDLGGGSIEDEHAEHKRSDFFDLRDFNLERGAGTDALRVLVECYKYWIALTDCDGFRIDTLKHVSFEQGRNFCGAIKEFANRLGKSDFFLVGEVAGGDTNQDRYLDVLGMNLNAALDIGEMRLALTGVARGLVHPAAYFDGFDPGKAVMGSHRNLGAHHVSVLDDHDHVFGAKLRFATSAPSPLQAGAAIALQLFTLGIPCVYYGTEQALAGPEPAAHHYLPGWGGSDRYLREAMFGPRHPRASGRAGLPANGGALDESLPGFGPFGTAGRHCFDPEFPLFRLIAAMNETRRRYVPLRLGRQYLRPTSFLGRPFAQHGAGELLAWSRILDDEELVCAVNTHGLAARGAAVLVDGGLNPPGSEMTVARSSSAAIGQPGHAPGTRLPVQRDAAGRAFVHVADVPPSGVVVLANHP